MRGYPAQARPKQACSMDTCAMKAWALTWHYCLLLFPPSGSFPMRLLASTVHWWRSIGGGAAPRSCLRVPRPDPSPPHPSWPQDPFFKRYAAEASRVQITLDAFVGSPGPMDLASLAAIPRYTCGQVGGGMGMGHSGVWVGTRGWVEALRLGCGQVGACLWQGVVLTRGWATSTESVAVDRRDEGEAAGAGEGTWVGYVGGVWLSTYECWGGKAATLSPRCIAAIRQAHLNPVSPAQPLLIPWPLPGPCCLL